MSHFSRANALKMLYKLLKVVFEDGHEADLADVQIYPSTKKVSFKVVKEVVHRTGRV
jgi:hypothetical protein